MKRILSLLLVTALAAGLCLTPALADEGLSMLPAVNDYAAAGYTDVPADSWYAQAARVCYETGLMTGTQAGFEAEMTLTGGQLAAIAARIREAIVGDAIPRATPLPGQSREWYADYVDYLTAAGIVAPSPQQPTDRLTFAKLLCAVLPNDYTPLVNSVASLPDTDDLQVLRLYNAGILTGADAYGTFNPTGTLRRHECAAMVARVVRPDLRQRFTLQTKPAEPVKTDPAETYGPLSEYERALLEAEALRVNGQSIPFELYLGTLMDIVFRTDFGMAANGGERLDWNAKYQGVDDLQDYFKNQAMSSAIEEFLIASQARAYNCSESGLPAALTPDPSAMLDKVYYAKHILVADQSTANVLLNQLMANPSLELFDQLMLKHSTDPGVKSNPEGYLFTDGQMVTSFENAVKALEFGSCTSAPVASDFGYHIILRLDPRTYPNWQKSVQDMFYEDYVNEWMRTCTVTPNTVELSKLDVQSWYARYLAQMGLS